ncbi:hypothetical protein pb186bvf_007054 [Paramecium bursaria]
MGNCFVSKPKKEKPEEDGQDSSESQSKALNLFKQKQKIKEDTITERVNGTLLKEDKKQSNIIQENQVSDPIRQRNEKKNKKFLQGVVILEQNTENITKLEREKKPTDYQLILNALSQHYFFTNISEKHKEDIVYKMFYCKVDSQQFIFKQGDQASSYYIIEKGQCEVLINDEHKRKIQAGQGFGELALLYGAPRSASIRALEETYLWGIDRSTFRKAVEELVQREFQENRTFIDSINFFDWMNSDQKDAIAGVIVTQQFKQDEPIVIEGDPATSYFIIKSGIVKIVKGGKEIRKMNEGDSFGEQALYQNSIRGASVIAESLEVKCLAIGREMITKILGDKIQVIMYNNLLKWSFEKNSLLCKLTKIQVEKIVSKIETVNYEAKQNVFVSNSKCDKLVIVLEGALENGVKQIATKGQMVGDQFLAQKNRDKLIPYDIFMDKKGKVAQITFDLFYECIGGELEQVIEKNQNNHEIKYMNKQKSQYVYDYLTLEQMIMIKKLGFGQFGSVYLCRNTKDHKLYAIKCIVKNQIVEQHLENHLVMEKKVLESVQFPLIMKFFKSLRDENNIYFLVEYIRGMELFDVIRDIGLLNIMDSQFFIGSLLLCMEYLHSHHIIYRDIKPENIMVDHQGYMRLIDMGTAKYLKGKGRTFTIIGTPHYMAPEIITGKGYTYTVDIWSIGVCLFEFMCGGVPFAEDAEDPYDIYEEIVKKPLTFPAFLKDKKTRKFCDQLLNKTPEQRIGTGYPAVKAHPWFETLDWDKLMDRELKPPYIPPKDKIISDKEIQRLESEGKQLINEIKIEQGEKAIYIKDKAKDPLWDQVF